MSAARLGRPRSEIVRLAIRDYAGRVGKLTEPERLRLLHLFDEVVPRSHWRPAAAVDREIRTLRRARRTGGRRGTARRWSISTPPPSWTRWPAPDVRPFHTGAALWTLNEEDFEGIPDL